MALVDFDQRLVWGAQAKASPVSPWLQIEAPL
jgi:hypothetical protein